MSNILVRLREKTISIVRRKPLVSSVVFFSLFMAFLLVLSASREPKTVLEKKEVTKKVKVFNVTEDSYVDTTGKVESSNIVTLYAQTAGVVNKISKNVGEDVKVGEVILTIATNYQGANVASIQAGLAAKQYDLAVSNYDDAKNALEKQRQLAEENAGNQDKLRQIAKDSLDDARTLVDSNERILGTLRSNLQNLKDTNVGGANDDAIFSLEQAVTGQLGLTLQTKSQLRNLELQEDNNPSASLITLSKEATLKQLDIQKRSLDASIDIARLQVAAARVAESLTKPASPVAGTVQRIFVSPNTVVAPGMPIAVVEGNQSTATIVSQIPQSLVPFIDSMSPSLITIEDEVIEVYPKFVSSSAIDGNLYTIVYEVEGVSLTKDSYININTPILTTDATILPLDALFQTQDANIVYTVVDGLVVAKEVELGDILGSYVEIKQGITSEDFVITSRNVVAGDHATF